MTTSATTTDGAHEDASSAIAPTSSDTATDPPLLQDADAPPDPLVPSSAPGAAADNVVYGTPVPTETHFASREELLAYVHGFTVQHGYAVVIQKSNVPRGQVWLRCDLGGSYRSTLGLGSENARKRKCSSRLKNCPFQLYARRLPDARWLLRVQNANHNHDVAADTEQLVTHPVARRMTLEQKKYVDELTEMGERPALIVEKMKEKFPDKPIKVQDIYNARNYIRRERSAGRVPFLKIAEHEEADEREQAVVSAAPAQHRQQNSNQADNGKQPATAVTAAAPPVLPASRRRSTNNSTPSLQQAAAAPLSASTHPLSVAATMVATPFIGAQASGNAAKKTNVAARERLQELLHDVNENFCTWQPRAQKQFLFQLDVLLEKIKKGTSHMPMTSLSPVGSQMRRQQIQQQQQSTAPATDSHSSDDADASLPIVGNRISDDTTALL